MELDKKKIIKILIASILTLGFVKVLINITFKNKRTKHKDENIYLDAESHHLNESDTIETPITHKETQVTHKESPGVSLQNNAEFSLEDENKKVGNECENCTIHSLNCPLQSNPSAHINIFHEKNKPNLEELNENYKEENLKIPLQSLKIIEKPGISVFNGKDAYIENGAKIRDRYGRFLPNPMKRRAYNSYKCGQYNEYYQTFQNERFKNDNNIFNSGKYFLYSILEGIEPGSDSESGSAENKFANLFYKNNHLSYCKEKCNLDMDGSSYDENRNSARNLNLQGNHKLRIDYKNSNADHTNGDKVFKKVKFEKPDHEINDASSDIAPDSTDTDALCSVSSDNDDMDSFPEIDADTDEHSQST